eukprot:s3552_g1.t1
MAREPLPDKAGPATHPPRTAVSAPRGRIPGTPINLPVRRDSTIRPANANLGTVVEGEGLNRGTPDSLDRELDAVSDIDIDSAELWSSASESEADRRCPQHSAASNPQQIVQNATAKEHGAETGLRSPLPGWPVDNDTPQDIGEGIHTRQATDATRMQDGGLRQRQKAGGKRKSDLRALLCSLELELVMMNLSNPPSYMDTHRPARESDFGRSQMSRPRPDGLRRKVGARRVSDLSALIEQPVIEMMRLGPNSPQDCMAPPYLAQGSDRWRNRIPPSLHSPGLTSAGLRREAGEWRASGFRALIELREMELVTLNLNSQ